MNETSTPSEGDQLPHKGRGRPPGSKNKKTLLAVAIQDGLEELLLEEVPKVFEKAIELAKGGDVQAMALVMKYTVETPEARTRRENASKGGGLGNNGIAPILRIEVVGKESQLGDTVDGDFEEV